jgi:hypothetical protein
MRCAQQLSPQGGPQDSLPPVVTLITPSGGSRHFTANRVFIEFNEYVQLKDASKEFFTSPLMKTKPTVTVRGRGVRVDIKDTLLPNRTYSLNFGNAVVDNNEGNVLHGLRYVFSTGSAIDSLIATGYTADAMRGDSVSRSYVFFYDAAHDTIPEYDSLLLKGDPLVVGRAEGNGIFIAQNLRDMLYKAYAFEDTNGNQRYDVGTDKVGFLDSVLNPATLAPISVWRDPYRHYATADPQLFFRLFGETAPRRQNFSGSERPSRHQAVLRFSAPHPQIDTLSFEGIPDDKVIREFMTPGRDTISLWFDMPPESLPDTIKGRMSYIRPDSLGVLAPASQDLRLAWRIVETREEQREREREEKEKARAEEEGEEYTPPAKPNPFAFKVDAGAAVNPEKSIPIEFGLPLATIDSARISLTATPDLGDPAPVPFRLVRDTMNIRRWVVSAEWDERAEYRLIIPEGVFVNIAGERNDSLGANFKIQMREEFTSLNLNVVGRNPESRYIVQAVDAAGKVIGEVRDAATGSYSFHYIPDGDVRVRVTEDGNANGRWDSGSLVERRQPERTEFYVGPTGDQVIVAEKGRVIDAQLDMGQIFAPVSISKIQSDLRRAEDARVSKYLEERAAREAEAARQGTSPTGAATGGLGIGSAMGSARQQIQSTVR